MARVGMLLTLLTLAGCLDGASRLMREGNRAAQAGRLTDARDAFSAALREQPGDVRAHVLLGHTLAALHETRGARSAYAAAIELDKGCAGARSGLARLALADEDPQKALELLTPLAATTETRLLRARALLARGQPDDGTLALTQLRDDTSKEATYLRGSALLLDRRFAEAQATLETLDAISAPLARYGMARVAAAQGRATDVVMHLQAAQANGSAAWDARAVAADPAFDFVRDTADFQPFLPK